MSKIANSVCLLEKRKFVYKSVSLIILILRPKSFVAKVFVFGNVKELTHPWPSYLILTQPSVTPLLSTEKEHKGGVCNSSVGQDVIDFGTKLAEKRFKCCVIHLVQQYVSRKIGLGVVYAFLRQKKCSNSNIIFSSLGLFKIALILIKHKVENAF